MALGENGLQGVDLKLAELVAVWRGEGLMVDEMQRWSREGPVVGYDSRWWMLVMGRGVAGGVRKVQRTSGCTPDRGGRAGACMSDGTHVHGNNKQAARTACAGSTAGRGCVPRDHWSPRECGTVHHAHWYQSEELRRLVALVPVRHGATQSGDPGGNCCVMLGL